MASGERFDRAGLRKPELVRPKAATKGATSLIWPIAPSSVRRVGDAVLAQRKKTGNPHHGVDIFAEAWSPVFAAATGRVLRIVDGRFSLKDSTKRAGLFVDVLGDDGLIFRYLHLGETTMVPEQRVMAGDQIAAIAPSMTSGAGEAPHLHFEIRESDFANGSYGKPINPLTRLPALRTA